MHNLFSIPAEATTTYEWSNDLQHARVVWKNVAVVDLVHIFPNWYVIANETFLLFRTEGKARAHITAALARADQRIAAMQWAQIEEPDPDHALSLSTWRLREEYKRVSKLIRSSSMALWTCAT